MAQRPLSPSRFAALLVLAFAFGSGSAEVAVHTKRAVEKARHEREVGSSGHLVALELTDERGEVVARPRLICPTGQRAELVLHDPLDPEDVRLAFRVAASREPSGEVALDWTLWVPERAVAESGTVSLTPGVEQAVAVGDGTLVATWLSVPVPSAAFDAYLEAEQHRRAAAPAPI
jgi:hypothetical protein